MIRLAPVVLALAAAACTTSDHVHSTPQAHRSTATACTASAGDSNGSDECLTDADCPDGGVCSCAGSTFEFAHETRNLCVASQCRTDADCNNTECSPSVGDCGTFYGVQGYFCHSAADTCARDSDCNQGGQAGYCFFSRDAGHWTCGYSFCAG